MQREKSDTDQRRGGRPASEAYLKRVGDRVRLARNRRGMTRRSLAQASGVSERYLADLERGSGNASLLVLRQIGEAMDSGVAVLAEARRMLTALYAKADAEADTSGRDVAQSVALLCDLIDGAA